MENKLDTKSKCTDLFDQVEDKSAKVSKREGIYFPTSNVDINRQEPVISIPKQHASISNPAQTSRRQTEEDNAQNSMFSPTNASTFGSQQHKHVVDRNQFSLSQGVPLLTFLMILILFCNIGLLCSKAILFQDIEENKSIKQQLINGDVVRRCPDKSYDNTCFEVTDKDHHVIYRSDNDKRILNFYRCSPTAKETQRHKCLGEYAFSHNSTVIYYHRLYLDKHENKHSLVIGPENLHNRDIQFPKVRQMLQYPYNWVIGFDDIPPDDFPEYQLYVKGQVMVGDIVNRQRTK